MFTKDKLEEYLERCLKTGADFAELFIEKRINTNYKYIDSKLDDIIDSSDYVICIRIDLGNNIVYGAVNVMDNDCIISKIDELIKYFDSDVKIKKVNLKEEKIPLVNDISIWPKDMEEEKKIGILHDIDSLTRSKDERIEQVNITLSENDSDVIIANSLGKYVNDHRLRLSIYTSLTVSYNDKKKNMIGSYGGSFGYEGLINFDFNSYVDNLVEKAIKKLDAIPCPGGEMPVVLGNGFCGTIMHEAVGHTLEATAVSIGESIMCGKLGHKVASSKLTLVDDGTIKNAWGSSNVDDEGNLTNRNILIDKGVITNYLVDYLNERKMNMVSNGCGRRESYLYAPTSRMSNTFIVNGNDKIDDMIKSIDYGLLVRNINGGTVKPETGDFNFNATSCALIRNGEIAEEVDDAILIGNALDIVKSISMVSDNMTLSTGYCGSLSGSVPVTVGEPYIKVDKIIVGGSDV